MREAQGISEEFVDGRSIAAQPIEWSTDRLETRVQNIGANGRRKKRNPIESAATGENKPINIATVVQRVFLRGDCAHIVTQHHERLIGMPHFGKPRQAAHVCDQQIKAVSSEAPEFATYRRASVSTMIVGVHSEAGSCQYIDKSGIPPNVFTETVRNLNHSPGRSTAIPPAASDTKSVRTGKLKIES